MSEFLMANSRASCYDEFCFQVLWPCLLYAVSDAPKTKFFYESASFKQYRRHQCIYSGSMIITFPSGLLRLLPKTALAPIGFFVHVTFPSSEIFCNLLVRNSPPRAILGADLVGFQSASYARHFRRTVSRILAYESLPKGIQVKGLLFLLVPVVKPRKSGGQAEGRKTKEKGAFRGYWCVRDGYRRKSREEKRKSEVQYWVQLLRQRYARMKLIVGRASLNGIRGARYKIKALEHFLKANPDFQGTVVLVQVSLQTTTSRHVSTLHPLCLPINP
ncbi:hypothetical protein EDD17DRAFT_863745 [Pisolithus thermaeus]|nr:hypothetical protein EDD17DRAFT_863745 [Pisolithus thermaeus]